MWGNKADNITIYDRPEFHKDKNSPLVKIHQIKTKRKRTGGQNGEFDLILLWSKKRFADPHTEEVPCDPELAKRIINGESILGTQQEYDNRLPYKDNDKEIDDDVPF
jgi:hypothetical protein